MEATPCVLEVFGESPKTACESQSLPMETLRIRIIIENRFVNPMRLSDFIPSVSFCVFRGRFCLLLLGVFLSLGGSAFADTFKCTMVSKSVILREGGFIPMDFSLEYEGRGFQEGRFEVEIVLTGEVLSRTRSPELVIAAGVRPVSLLIAPPQYRSAAEMMLRMRFVAKGKTWELGEQSFITRGMGKSSLVLGMFHAGRVQSEIEDEWQRSLRLESVHPDVFNENLNMATVIDRVDVEEMPTRTLDYCRFDIVCLNNATFAAAKEKQLDALMRWVEAGGSVCLSTNGLGLGEHHTAFLARIISADDGTKSKDGSISRHRVELGRAVIISRPLTSELLQSNDWKAAAGFLWKLHSGLVALLESQGTPGIFLNDQDYYNRGYQNSHHYIMSLMNEMAEERRDFVTQIPTWTIIALLAAFLILIGPGDYLVLGWLLRRRWTWIAFPVLCLLCTWSISALADHYLGSSDRRQVIRIVDLSKDGRVLREVRYEMSFSAKNRVFQTPVKNGAAVPMDLSQSLGRGRSDTPLSTTEWQSAGSEIFNQPASQWTLSTVCITTFSEGTDDSGVPWQDLRFKKSGDKLEVITGDTTGKSGWIFRLNESPHLVRGNYEHVNFSCMENLISQPGNGTLGKVITQKSPQLDAGLGDLTLENLTQEGWRHVVAWKRTPEGISLYRRPLKMEEQP